MQMKLLVLGALPAVMAGVPHKPKHTTTKTVYSTSVATVYSCAPTKTDCPAHSTKGPVVVTKVIPVSTTVCVEDDDEPTYTPKPDYKCSTTTKYKDVVITKTSTKKPYAVTTKVPVTTITKKYYETEYKTYTTTYTTYDKKYQKTTVTSTYSKPVKTEEVYSKYTSYSDCVHTVTNATVLYPYTKTAPVATYTFCPVKPTKDHDYPVKPTKGHEHPYPSKPVYDDDKYPVKPSEYVKPTYDYPVGAAQPTTYPTKTAVSPKPTYTAGAASFGAAGAVKMLGAAAAAAVLVL